MKFYRYSLVQYATKDSDGEYTNSVFPNPNLTLSIYSLVKETPKGYWIGYGEIKEKWVSKTSKKRYAYPTKKEALLNFIKRSEKRIKILKYQLESSEIGLELAKQKYNVVIDENR